MLDGINEKASPSRRKTMMTEAMLSDSAVLATVNVEDVARAVLARNSEGFVFLRASLKMLSLPIPFNLTYAFGVQETFEILTLLPSLIEGPMSAVSGLTETSGAPP